MGKPNAHGITPLNTSIDLHKYTQTHKLSHISEKKGEYFMSNGAIFRLQLRGPFEELRNVTLIRLCVNIGPSLKYQNINNLDLLTQ